MNHAITCCTHGIVFHDECHFCHMQKTINDFNERYELLNTDYIVFKSSFHKMMEISLDHNIKKINERIDETNKLVTDFLSTWHTDDDRIIGLESQVKELHKQPTESLATWNLLDERISRIESELHDPWKIMGNFFPQKKPHKCPVCEGDGSKRINAVICDCPSCSKTGIVWA